MYDLISSSSKATNFSTSDLTKPSMLLTFSIIARALPSSHFSNLSTTALALSSHVLTLLACGIILTIASTEN
ncbi:unnamed protein product, partial [Nesidiocoris tenuis]